MTLKMDGWMDGLINLLKCCKNLWKEKQKSKKVLKLFCSSFLKCTICIWTMV